MRTISFIILLFLSSLASAQTEVTKFLGIPVDGTKYSMIQKLEAKGFTYKNADGTEYLTGEFNGMDVCLFIKTNNNKVCRIMVATENGMDAEQVKIRFNKLCSQFDKNKRYIHSYSEVAWPIYIQDSIAYIDYNENIDFQMAVNKKRYEASFYQELEENVFLDREMIKDYISHFVNRWNQIYDKEDDKISYEDVLQQVTDYLDDKTPKGEEKMIVNYVLMSYYVEFVRMKSVWFMISEQYGKYYINIFYDNEYNKANGEDL